MAALTTQRIMLTVLAALVPGTLALCDWFGFGYLLRIPFAMTVGLAVEAAALAAQRRPVWSAWQDASTLVTCTLVALALPPGAGYGVLALAVAAAVGIGKHVYGGLGANPFNPAAVGYAVTLVSFPRAMATWPALTDGLSGATPLTTLRYREGQTVAEVWSEDLGFGTVAGLGWEWINLAFLLGGALLLARGIIAWRVPAALLGALALLAALGYDAGSSASLGSPLFHLFSGGTLLATFFFATDPVTHPSTHRGQIAFGIIIAAVAFVVRSFGNYPDGLVFGILLANAASPYLDRRLVTAHG